MEQQFKLPIFFHNLRGYNAPFLIKEVDTRTHGKVTAIPQSAEKYISLQIGNLIFKDSLSFLLTSLEECASKLNKDDLVFTRRYFENQAILNSIPVIDASESIVTPPSTPPPTTTTAHIKSCLPESTSGKRNSSTTTMTNHNSKRRRRNVFVDDKAEVSEEESEDDSDDDDSMNNFLND